MISVMAQKALDSVLSLGVTSVFTDMIHVHANDVNPPLLKESEAIEMLRQFTMPEDDVHLVSMNDYEFTTKAKDLASMHQDVSAFEEKSNEQSKCFVC